MPERSGLSTYREMRITLTEVNTWDLERDQPAVSVDWSIRTKPVDEDWGKGVVVLLGHARNAQPLATLTDALYWLHVVLCDAVDARM